MHPQRLSLEFKMQQLHLHWQMCTKFMPAYWGCMGGNSRLSAVHMLTDTTVSHTCPSFISSYPAAMTPPPLFSFTCESCDIAPNTDTNEELWWTASSIQCSLHSHWISVRKHSGWHAIDDRLFTNWAGCCSDYVLVPAQPFSLPA